MIDRDPMLKYAGGKRKIAADVAAEFGPLDLYAEPFVGSGAVLLHVDAPELRVADASPFIETWWCGWRELALAGVQPEDVLVEFKTWPTEVNTTFFLLMRPALSDDALRSRVAHWDRLGCPENIIATVALLFIMNKQAHNGLVRYSRTGKFNVPPAPEGQRIPRPTLGQIERHLHVGARLQPVVSRAGQLFHQLRAAKLPDRVGTYVDPPYLGGFTGYSPEPWGPVNFEDLIEGLRTVPGRVFLSEHATPDISARLGPHWREVRRWERPGTMSADSTKRQSVTEAIYTPE